MRTIPYEPFPSRTLGTVNVHRTSEADLLWISYIYPYCTPQDIHSATFGTMDVHRTSESDILWTSYIYPCGTPQDIPQLTFKICPASDSQGFKVKKKKKDNVSFEWT